MSDVITRRLIYDPVIDDYYYEYVWWTPAGECGVVFNDPRKRLLTAIDPGETRSFVWTKSRDLAADLAPLIAAHTDGNNNFVPPPTAPFSTDYWTIYDVPLRTGLLVSSGPIIYTGPAITP